MKPLSYFTMIFCCGVLASAAIAGPVPMSGGKEMKEVAPAPAPECDWSGFYVGLHVGGQWGHSEDVDRDYNVPLLFGGGLDYPWGYDESGVVAGGQLGYNFQWNWLVLGVEGDLGYMNLEGRGTEDASCVFAGCDTFGKTNSDFYTTVRGRLGFAWQHWLFYGTGGWIGVNEETKVIDDCDVFPCGGTLIHAGDTDFRSGWTAGGGVEYMIACHWTIRAEYLRFQVDDHSFDAVDNFGAGPFHFKAPGTQGNIVRAGLNYKF